MQIRYIHIMQPGTRHGQFTIIERDYTRKGSYAFVGCEAGHCRSVQWYSFKYKPRICPGCVAEGLSVRSFAEKQRQAERAGRPNGKSYPSEFQCWQNIKKRCLNPNHKQYDDYGRRGIGMYLPWQTSFAAFMAHVGPKPHPGVSLDRIDNDKGYIPGNLRWATPRVQNNNKRPAFRPIDEPRVSGYLVEHEVPWCF